ncbi:phosphoglycerate dehydrogenase [Denitratisoma oestradiolicum]|uniref:D-3-phosphoglycerate dehydrogenase n=1 Tax=Denitratisoma oestradiolicum TaxID=311182 RepID=A0A6S6Y0G0_9PROT|nr:phosphoglycerate dehydrogenase [Denitratisoma oestradiolicum]TWO80184.1 3-phosphoglycerate dehydrogenase [Denitratisoma oestradiolicum]CAB1369965.1 Phosphoglycerate dehydrogenase-like oxidoreductase [Denitratisoma oestradiolicum]
MANQFQILILNQISATGLKRLPERYTTGKDIKAPDAVLVRSADMHGMDIPASVRAIGRAGAGTNNIPVKAMSQRGVPVFNAPGANANAVKELVLVGMLLAARNIAGALDFVAKLDTADPEMDRKVEDGKKSFAGYELAGQTLGIIGLGKIGCLVADAAIKLGMNVYGYDPEITVDAAWSLPSQVRKAHSVAEVLKHAQFISLHVPLVDATRNLINADNIGTMKHGAVLLNFSREGVVNEAAVLAALAEKKLGRYVCDFPSAAINGRPGIIALPHLGASTQEAEENCAVMVADQLVDYLEHGNIQNAVNFPNVSMPRESTYRLAIANANVPNMVGQISTALAQAGLNIHNMVNKSRGEMAYTLVDVDSKVTPQVIDGIARIEGVLAVRYLPLEA